MTAATWRPSTPDTFLTERDGDKVAMRIALVIAALLHLAFLAMPVMQSAPPEESKIIACPLEIREAVIPPPPLEQVQIERTALDYHDPVPVPMVDDPEPIYEEPAVEPIDVSYSDAPIHGDELDVVAPPAPLPAIVDEGHRDLILPVPIEPREPLNYPKMGRITRKEGVVILQAVIDEQGRVTDIEILRGVVPDLGFDDEAVRAVSLWRYQPGTIRGQPVKVRMRVLVDFSLN